MIVRVQLFTAYSPSFDTWQYLISYPLDAGLLVQGSTQCVCGYLTFVWKRMAMNTIAKIDLGSDTAGMVSRVDALAGWGSTVLLA